MIGWYVHHHGAGHLQQLRLVSKHVRTPITGLSSLGRPDWWQNQWEVLPRDDAAPALDTAARGVLHWAPRLHDGLRRRGAMICRWIDETKPVLLVVDVSVEVALLARLLGIPVVVAAMRGARGDRPHAAAYDVADALLAPWPATQVPAGWPSRWTEKTWHVGAFSEFDAAPRRRPPGDERQRVLLLVGDGGTDIDTPAVAAARAATPGWNWTIAGIGARLSRDELWSALCDSDVVISHAGQSAVAEVAAARRPAIIFAQQRPHGEQIDTASTLQRAGIAIGLDQWPPPSALPNLLAAAKAIDPVRWSEWSPGNGARQAAVLLDRLACRLEASRGR
jgi:hypothetical protein